MRNHDAKRMLADVERMVLPFAQIRA